MKRAIRILFILAVFGNSAVAQENERITSSIITDRKVVREGDSVIFSFRVDVEKRLIPKSISMLLVPAVVGDGEAWPLPVIAVQSRRAAIAMKRHQWAAPAKDRAMRKMVYMKPGETLKYRTAVAWQPWMDGADFTVKDFDMGCCAEDSFETIELAGKLALPPLEKAEPKNTIGTEGTVEAVASAPAAPQKSPVPQQSHATAAASAAATGRKLEQSHVFVRPASEMAGADPEKLFDDARERENAVTISYVRGGNMIDPNFNGNGPKLADLMDAIHALEASPDSRVAKVVIAGFASPEGTLQVNDRIARERAEALKQFIMEHSGIPASAFVIHNGGEDWQGLKILIQQSNMPLKRKVLDIIERVPLWDAAGQRGREGALMLLDEGRPYRYMYMHFFPKLRNSAYIRVFYDSK